MDQELLVDEQIKAGLDFVQDFSEYVSVAVAVWVKPTESAGWYLYLASDELNDSNIRAGYGEVLRRLGKKRSQWLNPFQIKLVNSSDPVARDAMKFRDCYPDPIATRYRRLSIGDLSIDGAFIYSSLCTATCTP